MTKFPIREDYDAYLERCIEEERRLNKKENDEYHPWNDPDKQRGGADR